MEFILDFPSSLDFSEKTKQRTQCNGNIPFYQEIAFFHEYCTCTNGECFTLTLKTFSKYNDLQTNVKTN